MSSFYTTLIGRLYGVGEYQSFIAAFPNISSFLKYHLLII
jgi:hypothetical protein